MGVNHFAAPPRGAIQAAGGQVPECFVEIKAMKSSLTSKNQVTVPAAIAAKLKLEPGARFDWSIGDDPNTIIIRVQPSRRAMLARLRELGLKSRGNEPDSVAQLIAERAADEK